MVRPLHRFLPARRALLVHASYLAALSPIQINVRLDTFAQLLPLPLKLNFLARLAIFAAQANRLALQIPAQLETIVPQVPLLLPHVQLGHHRMPARARVHSSLWLHGQRRVPCQTRMVM